MINQEMMIANVSYFEQVFNARSPCDNEPKTKKGSVDFRITFNKFLILLLIQLVARHQL